MEDEDGEAGGLLLKRKKKGFRLERRAPRGLLLKKGLK
jgi:hypothetical protein